MTLEDSEHRAGDPARPSRSSIADGRSARNILLVNGETTRSRRRRSPPRSSALDHPRGTYRAHPRRTQQLAWETWNDVASGRTTARRGRHPGTRTPRAEHRAIQVRGGTRSCSPTETRASSTSCAPSSSSPTAVASTLRVAIKRRCTASRATLACRFSRAPPWPRARRAARREVGNRGSALCRMAAPTLSAEQQRVAVSGLAKPGRPGEPVPSCTAKPVHSALGARASLRAEEPPPGGLAALVVLDLHALRDARLHVVLAERRRPRRLCR